MLKRLKGRASTYSVKSLKTDHRKFQKILENICEFPYNLGRKNPIHPLTFNATEPRLRIIDDVGLGISLEEFESEEQNAQILFKRGLVLNDIYLLIEITREDELWVITAFSVENPTSFVLKLQDKRMQEILGEKKDFEAVCERLKLENEELILE
jgi:hypothetical protein